MPYTAGDVERLKGRTTGWSRDEETGDYTYVDAATGELRTTSGAFAETPPEIIPMAERGQYGLPTDQPEEQPYSKQILTDWYANEKTSLREIHLTKYYAVKKQAMDMSEDEELYQLDKIRQEDRMAEAKLQQKNDKIEFLFEIIDKDPRLSEQMKETSKEGLMKKLAGIPTIQKPKVKTIEQYTRDIKTLEDAIVRADAEGNAPLVEFYGRRLDEKRNEMTSQYGMEIYEQPGQEIEWGRDIPPSWEQRMVGEQAEPISATNPQTGEKIVSYDGGRTWDKLKK